MFIHQILICPNLISVVNLHNSQFSFGISHSMANKLMEHLSDLTNKVLLYQPLFIQSHLVKEEVQMY